MKEHQCRDLHIIILLLEINNGIIINCGTVNGTQQWLFPLAYTRNYNLVATGSDLNYTFHFNCQGVNLSTFAVISRSESGATKPTDNCFFLCIGI